jgi:hypothetical protein
MAGAQAGEAWALDPAIDFVVADPHLLPVGMREGRALNNVTWLGRRSDIKNARLPGETYEKSVTSWVFTKSPGLGLRRSRGHVAT